MKKKIVCIFYTFLLLVPFVQGQQMAPSILWQKTLGGSGNDWANVVIKTIDNGFLLAGASNSNDGDVTGHHGPPTTGDGWVVKLSSSGDIEWQKSIGGTLHDEFKSVIVLRDGSYLCMGITSSTDGDAIGNHGQADIFLVKLDRSGNIVWKKCIGGTKEELAGNIKLNKDGTIFFIGSTYSNDGDVSGNHTSLDGSTTKDIWVVKLAENGTILSQRCFGGNAHDVGHDIEESSSGDYYIAIDNMSDDGDFGTAGGPDPRGQLVKLSAANVVLRKTTGTIRTDFVQLKIMETSGGRDTIFIAGDYISCYPTGLYPAGGVSAKEDFGFQNFNSVGGYPGFASCSAANLLKGPHNFSMLGKDNTVLAISTNDITIPGHHGGMDGLVAGLRTFNSVAWKRSVGGSGADYLNSTSIINEFEFVVAGYTNSNNGDVSGNHGGNDVWIIKMGKVNLIKGSVYTDYNLNGNKEANEPYVSNILMETQKDNLVTTTSTYQGIFGNVVDTGTYITKALSTIQYYSVAPGSISSTFSSYNNLDSISFSLRPIPGKRDYRVDLYSLSAARSGFDMAYKIYCLNAGTDTLLNKTVRFVKDSRLQFKSSHPIQTSINGDTIIWNIAVLSPRDTMSITIELKAEITPVLNIGDTLYSEADIDATSDLNPSNNRAPLVQRIIGAFDPNDKQESRGGNLYKNDYDAGAALNYTIRFQNTGNDTAFNVIIRDTLETKVDATSIEVIGASHPFQFTMKDNKYCTWTFTNIKLPDSNINEKLSHGYISYRITPKTGLTVGDTLRNSASIYFDFNLPIKTNTHETILRSTPANFLPQPQVSGLLNNYCNNQGIQKGKINNLPVSASGITVTVKLDNTSLSVASDSTFSFDVNPLTVANHTITVSYSNGSTVKTFTHVFSVTATISPDVNVSANITNITNLATPVIITGSNAAGGGTAPLYSFAKDRTFTTILQAEGVSNMLNIDPSSLTIGDNWIYIRMKSNATCITSQIAIDSIKLVRDMMTGITDPDNPGKVISLYPNPFNKQIFISGLSAGKSYIINITNLNGQLIQQARISNRTSAELVLLTSKAGTYMLTIYDEKKKLSLGTMKIIKQ